MIFMLEESLLQKWQTEYKKGFSKPLILFALQEVGKSTAFPLIKKIVELSKGQITIVGSNIYPMLKSLVDENLIEKDEDLKFYQLTQGGKEFLLQLGYSLSEFTQMLLKITEKNANQDECE